MSITLPALPNEILLNIFKHCSATDICQIQLTSRSFQPLARDQWLWKSLCQRAFPELEFRDVGQHFKHTYQHEVHKYRKLVGIWVKQTNNGTSWTTHNSPMAITTRGASLFGFYFTLYVAYEFGDEPDASPDTMSQTLQILWDAETQAWGDPFTVDNIIGLVRGRNWNPQIGRAHV